MDKINKFFENQRNWKIFSYLCVGFVIVFFGYIIITTIAEPKIKPTQEETARWIMEHGSGSLDPWE